MEEKTCQCGQTDHAGHVLVEQDNERKALLAAALVFYEALDRAGGSRLLTGSDDLVYESFVRVDLEVPELIGRLRDEVVVNEHGAEFLLVREHQSLGELRVELFGPLGVEQVPTPVGVPAEGFAKHFHRKAVDHG